MVGFVACLWTLFACPGVAAGQVRASRFGISDNSFLVEEAFNQEAGIFQNIFVVSRGRDGTWAGSFTQEWPLRGQRHQGSVTIPFSRDPSSGAMGDAMLNYRLQVWAGGDGRPAFAPRLSVILPTSIDRRGLGPGWQVNLPFSFEVGRISVHANAGMTWLEQNVGPAREWDRTPFAAGSLIIAARPMWHAMLELYTEWPRDALAARHQEYTIVPGVRGGWNLGDRQLVVGAGVSITRGATEDTGILMYLSFELPFVGRK